MLLLSAAPVLPQLRSQGFDHADNHQVRSRYAQLLTEPVDEVASVQPVVERQAGIPEEVRVEVQTTRDYQYIVFRNGSEGSFPMLGPGTVAVRRLRATGEVDQYKVFLRGQEEFFVRLRPGADWNGSPRTQVELVLAGVPIIAAQPGGGMPLPIAFPELPYFPMSGLTELLASRIDPLLLDAEPADLPLRPLLPPADLRADPRRVPFEVYRVLVETGRQTFTLSTTTRSWTGETGLRDDGTWYATLAINGVRLDLIDAVSLPVIADEPVVTVSWSRALD